MTDRQIEVHNFYKKLHPEALILYNLPSRYVVLGEDVQKASESLSQIQVVNPDVAIIPESISLVAALGRAGHKIRIIRYRNDSGSLAFPDIQRIIDEQAIDY